jgi:hypothetical protein
MSQHVSSVVNYDQDEIVEEEYGDEMFIPEETEALDSIPIVNVGADTSIAVSNEVNTPAVLLYLTAAVAPASAPLAASEEDMQEGGG